MLLQRLPFRQPLINALVSEALFVCTLGANPEVVLRGFSDKTGSLTFSLCRGRRKQYTRAAAESTKANTVCKVDGGIVDSEGNSPVRANQYLKGWREGKGKERRGWGEREREREGGGGGE